MLYETSRMRKCKTYHVLDARWFEIFMIRYQEVNTRLKIKATVNVGGKTRMQKLIVPYGLSIVKFYIITQFLLKLKKWSPIHIPELLEHLHAIIAVESITCIVNNLNNYPSLIFCLSLPIIIFPHKAQVISDLFFAIIICDDYYYLSSHSEFL